MAIVNGPSADACLRGQHRAWTAMCAAGNSLLVDHWLQVTPTPRLSSPFCCPLSPAAFARRSRGGWTTCRRHLRSSLPGRCISSTWTASWGSWRGVSPRAATVCWGRHAGAASTAALSGTASGAPQETGARRNRRLDHGLTGWLLRQVSPEPGFGFPVDRPDGGRGGARDAELEDHRLRPPAAQMKLCSTPPALQASSATAQLAGSVTCASCRSAGLRGAFCVKMVVVL